MATTLRNGLPEFWVTGLAKVLVGENPCEFAPWIKGHYRIEKVRDQSNMAQWKVDHTARLQELTQQYQRDGWSVSLEQYIKLRGTTAVVAGKADCVRRKQDCRPVIVDVKTGTPRDSDVVQVLIYMIILPLAWQKALTFAGEVVYRDHVVTITPEEAGPIKPKLFALVRKLGLDARPEQRPSEGNCRFCDVSDADCPVRWKEDAVDALTSEF